MEKTNEELLNNLVINDNEDTKKINYYRFSTNSKELIMNNTNLHFSSFCNILKFHSRKKMMLYKNFKIKNSSFLKHLIDRIYVYDSYLENKNSNMIHLNIRCKVLTVLDLQFGIYAILTNNREFLIYDLMNRLLIKRIKTIRKGTCICKLTTPNKYVLGTQDGAIMFFDTSSSLTNNLLKEYVIGSQDVRISDVKLLIKGFIVVVSNDNSISTFDEVLMKRIYRLENAHSHWIHSITILRPNGLFTKNNTSSFITTSHDSTIKIWNEEIYLTKTLTGHTSAVFHCIELKNGDLASCSADWSIFIWKIIDKNYTIKDKMRGHKNDVFKLRELSNGNIVSLSKDSKLLVWDLISCKQVMEFRKKNKIISDILEVNGYYLISSNNLVICDKEWNILEMSK